GQWMQDSLYFGGERYHVRIVKPDNGDKNSPLLLSFNFMPFWETETSDFSKAAELMQAFKEGKEITLRRESFDPFARSLTNLDTVEFRLRTVRRETVRYVEEGYFSELYI